VCTIFGCSVAHADSFVLTHVLSYVWKCDLIARYVIVKPADEAHVCKLFEDPHADGYAIFKKIGERRR